MKAILLDVHVLIALLWTRHEHHAVAHRWFAGAAEQGWATCTLTQLGFLRIVCNAAFSSEAVRPAQATAVLKANLRHPAHQEWKDPWGAAAVLEPLADRLVGHRHVTDTYLLGLAAKHDGRLATFDRGLDTLAPASSRFARHLERISLAAK